MINFAGAQPVPIPLREERQFRLDVNELADRITSRTRVIILNSPANPTGGVLDEQDVRDFVSAISDRNIMVLSDEIYSRLIFEGRHFSPLSIPEFRDRAILLDGFSKTYAMTGWRFGLQFHHRQRLSCGKARTRRPLVQHGHCQVVRHLCRRGFRTRRQDPRRRFLCEIFNCPKSRSDPRLRLLSSLNVLIVGAHAGVSVGPNGATHQALEDLFAVMGLPKMSVVVPCDIVEARRATTYLLLPHFGPKYIRFAREATPIVTTEDTPFVFGKANRIRLRHSSVAFANAFETRLDEECRDEQEDLTIVACGPEVPEAMRAAWTLRQEFGYTTRILNMHTLKPIDTASIIRATLETAAIVTAEEPQIGALAERVCSLITESPKVYSHPVITAVVGQRPFRRLRRAEELVRELEVSPEHIATRANEFMQHKHEPVAAHAQRGW